MMSRLIKIIIIKMLTSPEFSLSLTPLEIIIIKADVVFFHNQSRCCFLSTSSAFSLHCPLPRVFPNREAKMLFWVRFCFISFLFFLVGQILCPIISTLNTWDLRHLMATYAITRSQVENPELLSWFLSFPQLPNICFFQCSFLFYAHPQCPSNKSSFIVR